MTEDKKKELDQKLKDLEDKMGRKFDIVLRERNQYAVEAVDFFTKHFPNEITREKYYQDNKILKTLNHNIFKPKCCGRFYGHPNEINSSYYNTSNGIGVYMASFIGDPYVICPKCLGMVFCSYGKCEIGHMAQNYIKSKYPDYRYRYQLEMICSQCYKPENNQLGEFKFLLTELKRRNNIMMSIVTLAQLNYRFPETLTKLIVEYSEIDNTEEFKDFFKEGVIFGMK